MDKNKDISAAEKPTGDLTDEQIERVWIELPLTGAYNMGEARIKFARAIERAAIAAHLERQAQQAEDSKTQSEKVGAASAGGPPVSDAVRRLSERLKWMLDADQFSNIESMLRAIDLSEQPTLGSFPLICGACGEDRLKNPCSNPSDCSMIAMSFNVPTEIRSFALGGGFWARRESRTDGSIGWLLCDETDRIIRALDRHECSLIDATFVAAGNQRAAAPASQEGAHAALDEVRDAVRDAVAGALSGTYYCGRVWSAWGVGTMSEDDFSPADEDDDILDGVVDAVFEVLKTPASAERSGDHA